MYCCSETTLLILKLGGVVAVALHTRSRIRDLRVALLRSRKENRVNAKYRDSSERELALVRLFS